MTIETVPTQSALLELRDERLFVREGHEFLDQKRTLQATELLRWLARYDRLRARLMQAQQAASVALAEACARHGTAELGEYPIPPQLALALSIEWREFLGISMADASVALSDKSPAPIAPNPSPEARRCGARFTELSLAATELAAASGNLRRLMADYRRTERRARSLENVILPELVSDIKRIEEQLEEQEQEEAVRLRLRRRAP